MHQSKTALRIRQRHPQQPGKPRAHPAIHEPPQPRHLARFCHPIADNQVRTGCVQKSRNVTSRMLSIPIHQQSPLVAALMCVAQATLDCRALALIVFVPDDLSSGVGCCLVRTIARAVVHDDNVRQQGQHTSHNGADMFGLVQARNDRCAIHLPIVITQIFTHCRERADSSTASRTRWLRRPSSNVGWTGLPVRQAFTKSATVCTKVCSYPIMCPGGHQLPK